MNVAQRKIVNLLKTVFCSSVFVSVCVFNVWPKTTPLLPVWPRDAERLDTRGRVWGWGRLADQHWRAGFGAVSAKLLRGLRQNLGEQRCQVPKEEQNP